MRRVAALSLAVATAVPAAACLNLHDDAPIAVAASTAPAQTPERVWVPCSEPNGWNSTDASREANGVPNGFDHQCLVERPGS
jgi:hypothetical protein